ncbi:hypothetical protein BASA50_001856 [Batrachochytrium salamandrivorans]|uniref:Coiled-coil domain-containing protein 112-like n=1 Tax=Batrachochytrium salamandrivorans TaxID=1357716 RepID=A0ABQ8FMZ4_9FUNG|nr:hypothetical protein BASA62_000938 [Batrachochytrium salamandrivorans]KAH6597430.1 hypothetical protein BASA61_003158 [Batrachochytrium salamandrivorans]KAH6601068.1 hypothetical protein BASA50_001856 [Batrachochytrium salamandrivorans]
MLTYENDDGGIHSDASDLDGRLHNAASGIYNNGECVIKDTRAYTSFRNMGINTQACHNKAVANTPYHVDAQMMHPSIANCHRISQTSTDKRNKKEILDTWVKQRIKISTLERELQSLYSKSTLHEAIRDADPTYTITQSPKLDHTINSEMGALNETIQGIRDKVIKFIVTVKAPQEGYTYVENLKSTMETIQSEIEVFKNKSKSSLDSDLKGGNNDTTTTGLLPEVVSFQKYLAKNGGHYGGWDDQAHSIFMKYRIKFGISGASESSLRDHEGWFNGYTNHLEAQKNAIFKWRQQKRMAIKNIQESLVCSKQGKEITVLINSEKEAENRERKQEMLQKWKNEKSRQKAEYEQKARIQKQKDQENDLLKSHAEKSKAKKLIGEYYEKKAKDEELRKKWEKEVAILCQQNSKACNNGIKETQERFLQRDKAIAQKRIDLKQEKALRFERQKQRIDLSKQQVYVSKDPNRLLQPTKVYINHMTARNQQRGEDNVASSFRVNTIPRRLIPAWRVEM